MTFVEIYNSVVMRLWGDTTPPTSAVTTLQGPNGTIANAYRQIQQDYNYWFMRAYTSFPTVVGYQTYGLPDEFKELISVQFKKEDEDYFLDPLSILKLTQPFKSQWNANTPAKEYPDFYEFVGEDITIYPAPSEIRTLHLIYWSFFARPTAAYFTLATTIENDVTKYAGDIISYMAAADYSLIQKEYDQYQIYSGKSKELIVELKQEDYRRRQANMQFITYEEF